MILSDKRAMRMLLTSAGITNKAIAKVLKGWVPEIRIAFIPPASNIEEGDKDWLIDDYVNCKRLGPVDIVDISALEKNVWLPRLRRATVIVVGGGHTEHLMRHIRSSGLKDELPNLLKTRVYVGISAGSIVMSKTLNATSERLFGDEPKKPVAGLGYVDFNTRPHLNSPHFPKVRDAVLKKLVKILPGDTYALDDDSAIAIDGKAMSVVSEGKWILYKKR